MFITINTLKDILNVFKKEIKKEINQSSFVSHTINDIPSINIIGKLPSKKVNVPCVLEYSSLTHSFKANIKIKVQGQSSALFPKRNYSIELYGDEYFNIPMNKSFKNWGSHNKYVLKANYTDHLHARNIVCANLWANIVRNRKDFDTLPEELKTSPNMGAIDGFPIKLYANGEYKGIYTWNIPKKAWMFNTDKKNSNHAVLQGNANDFGLDEYKTNPCNFNALWNGSSYWTIEEGKESDELTESFNKVIRAVANSDKVSLEKYLDIQSAIDYFIFQDVVLGIDGLSNNMLCLTYDMQKWYLSAYDMDATFGLKASGEMNGTPTDAMPTTYLNQHSALLDLLTNNYDSEMKNRYAELRKNELSYFAIVSAFEKFLAVASEDERIKDVIPYSDIPNVTTNTFENLKTFIKERLEYLDTKYEVVI